MSLLVNISTLVANSEIRKEVVEGVEFTVLPSKTLPPEIVMNGILYPAEEVEATINTLDGSPVTMSHPVINGKFADAYEPISQAKFGLGGAFNKVRGKSADGSWIVEKFIPTEQLQNTERGKKLAEAIKHKRPIHTSTGVYLTREPEIGVNAMGQEYTSRAKIDRFNHDAILLNEVGAATPEQGVGIFVNADGALEEVEVMYVNVDSEEVEGKVIVELKGGLLATLLDTIKNMVKSTPEQESIQNHNREGNTVEKEEVDKMIADALVVNATTIDESVRAICTDVCNQMMKTMKTNSELAEKDALVQQVVNAKLLPEDAAKECSMAALKAMLECNSQGQPAMGLRRGVASNQDEDIFANYKIEG